MTKRARTLILVLVLSESTASHFFLFERAPIKHALPFFRMRLPFHDRDSLIAMSFIEIAQIMISRDRDIIISKIEKR